MQPTAFSTVLSPGGTSTEIYKAPASERVSTYVFPGGVSEGFLGHISSSATYQVPDQTPRSGPIPEGQLVEFGAAPLEIVPAPYVDAKPDLGSRDVQQTADRGYVLPPAEAGYSTPFRNKVHAFEKAEPGPDSGPRVDRLGPHYVDWTYVCENFTDPVRN